MRLLFNANNTMLKINKHKVINVIYHQWGIVERKLK